MCVCVCVRARACEVSKSKVSSKLAKKYLGIVATSVPSERLFSQAGQVILDRRARITPKNVNMVLFLNSYLKK